MHSIVQQQDQLIVLIRSVETETYVCSSVEFFFFVAIVFE